MDLQNPYFMFVVYFASVLNWVGWYFFHRWRDKKINGAMRELKDVHEEVRADHLELEKEILEFEDYRNRNIGRDSSNELKIVIKMDDGTIPDKKTMDEILTPQNIVRGMSYDDFIDWLDLGDYEDVISAKKVFSEHNMEQHVNIIDVYLKNKFPNK